MITMSLYTVGDLTREYGWLMAFWYNAPVQQLKELPTILKGTETRI